MMLWCKYCNREIDERCNLCKYKDEAEEDAKERYNQILEEKYGWRDKKDEQRPD